MLQVAYVTTVRNVLTHNLNSYARGFSPLSFWKYRGLYCRLSYNAYNTFDCISSIILTLENVGIKQKKTPSTHMVQYTNVERRL